MKQSISTVKIYQKNQWFRKQRKRSVLHVFDSDEKFLLVSYIDKKESGKRNVVVLSTLHDEVRVTKDEQRKPDIHKLYDHTKGGIDVGDLISRSCTTRIKKGGQQLHLYLFWTLFEQMSKPFFKKLPQNSKCETLNLHMHLVSYWCCHSLKEDMLTQTESKLI